MTTLVDFGQVAKMSFRLNNFRTAEITSHARPFGCEPNALPKPCNCLIQKILAPRGGFEPPTFRLTAECSTIELPGNRKGRISFLL